jgi:Histidine kinase
MTHAVTQSDQATTEQSAAAPELTRRHSNLALIGLFWVYAAATNVLMGASMKASLAGLGIQNVFAPWNVRLVQHLLLFPALLGCMRLARRVGWQPLWRAVPLQVLFGFVFSTLGGPAMDFSEAIFGYYSWHNIRIPGLVVIGDHYPGKQSYVWVASAVGFLIDYAFCLALQTGFEYYRRYRDSQVREEALERSLGAAQLAALRMQLSPHTLFNLLHTIRGHISWDPKVAQSMIVQLGDLLRRALRAGEHDLSRLQDELEFARLYLALQQRRFSDRLVVEVPGPEACPPVWVPSLILQPLIENAVVHGLAQTQSTVMIRVEIDGSGETLVLRVLNSLPSVGSTAPAERPGIGLRNVRERLAIQFGGRATFNAGRSSADQWVCELHLPLLRTDA